MNIDKAISILISKNQSVFFENHEPTHVAPTKDILSIINNQASNNLNYDINYIGKNYRIVYLEKDEKRENCFNCIIEHAPANWPIQLEYGKIKQDVSLPWLYMGAKVIIDKERFAVVRHPKMMYQVKICMSPERIVNIHNKVFGLPLPNMWQENVENGPWWICTGNIEPRQIESSSLGEYMKKLLYSMILSQYSTTYIPSMIRAKPEKYTKFNEWMQEGIFFGANPDKEKWPILTGSMKEFINLWL